jgi:putative flippase GtrA
VSPDAGERAAAEPAATEPVGAEPAGARAPSLARSLSRATLASCIATGCEFAILPVLVHVLHVRDWIAYSSVQFLANAITFLLYKYWAFEARDHGLIHIQYGKQLVIFAGSLVLNTAIPSLLSYRLHVEQVLAFAISQVVVYLVWNYPGNRYWVFKR